MENSFLFLFRTRDKPQDAVSGAPTFYFGTSASGKVVNFHNPVKVSTVCAGVRVIATVNHNGGKDSTGTITENIIGAQAGHSGISAKYTEKPERRDLIIEVSDAL